MGDGILQRTWWVLSEPGRAMDAVRERPRWAAAALICLVCVGLMAAFTLQITGPEQIDLMRETRLGRNMDPDKLDEMYARFEEISPGQRVLQGFQAGVGVLFSLIVVAGVLHLAAKVAGGQASFRHTLAVVSWANIVGVALASLIKWPLILARGSSLGIAFGPAVLVADRGPTDALFQLLSFLDVLTIWTVVLMAIGLERVHALPRGKAYGATIGASLLMGAVMFGVARLFS